MAGAGDSNRVCSIETSVRARTSPQVVHESRHGFVAIVAIRPAAVLLLGQTIAHRTALALRDNQVCRQQVLQITLEGALGGPVGKERKHLTWREHPTRADALQNLALAIVQTGVDPLAREQLQRPPNHSDDEACAGVLEVWRLHPLTP